MKKVLLLLMLLLPLGGTLQSCSDDDELSYYDQVLEAKIQMVNEFKTKFKKNNGNQRIGVKEGETFYHVGNSTENIEIVDGRYLTIGSYVFDLMHLIGYTGSYNADGLTYGCMLMFE